MRGPREFETDLTRMCGERLSHRSIARTTLRRMNRSNTLLLRVLRISAKALEVTSDGHRT